MCGSELCVTLREKRKQHARAGGKQGPSWHILWRGGWGARTVVLIKACNADPCAFADHVHRIGSELEGHVLAADEVVAGVAAQSLFSRFLPDETHFERAVPGIDLGARAGAFPLSLCAGRAGHAEAVGCSRPWKFAIGATFNLRPAPSFWWVQFMFHQWRGGPQQNSSRANGCEPGIRYLFSSQVVVSMCLQVEAPVSAWYLPVGHASQLLAAVAPPDTCWNPGLHE